MSEIETTIHLPPRSPTERSRSPETGGRKSPRLGFNDGSQKFTDQDGDANKNQEEPPCPYVLFEPFGKEVSPTLAANEKAKKLRAEGHKVIHVAFGESPFPVPPLLMNELQRAAHRKDYLSSIGEDRLREQVARYYASKTNIDMTKFDVVISAGSKMTLYLTAMAIEGDLMLPDPSWVSYAPQAAMLRQKHFVCPASLDDEGYHINPEDLAKSIDDARAAGGNPTKILLNYPNNPTGLNMTRPEMEAIAKVCLEKNVFIISDEIYGFTSYDGNYHSFAEFTPENVLVTTGLSKHLALGGWRVGIGLVPKAVPGLTRALVTLQSETSSCLASPISQACIMAFVGDPEIETHIRNCTKIHQLLTTYACHEMRKAGATVQMPHGGFYLYPDFTAHAAVLKEKVGIETAQDLADFMSEEYHVIILPAQCFMSSPNRLAFRFACNDYKGGDALNALVEGEELDDAFVEKYTPNIVQALKAFQDLARRAGFYSFAYEKKREEEIAEAKAAAEQQ